MLLTGVPVTITDNTPSNNRKMHKLFESFTAEIQRKRVIYLHGRGRKTQKETKQNS